MDGDDVCVVREARLMPEDVVERIASLNVSGERRASDDASDERATAAGDEDAWHAPPPRLSLGHLTERPSERSRAQPALVGLRLA